MVLYEAGNVTEKYWYSPYGEVVNATVTGQSPTELKFSGHEEENEGLPGFYYAGARYYNSSVGIWYSGDPAGQGFTPYLYAGNNPLLYIDEDGEFWWIVAGAAIGAYLGGASAQDNWEWNPGKWDWNNTNTYLGVLAGGATGAFAANAIAGPWGLNIGLGGPQPLFTLGGHELSAVIGGLPGAGAGLGIKYLDLEGNLMPIADNLSKTVNNLNNASKIDKFAPSSDLSYVYQEGRGLYEYENSIIYYHQNIQNYPNVYFSGMGNTGGDYHLDFNDCSERDRWALRVTGSYPNLPQNFASSTASMYLGTKVQNPSNNRLYVVNWDITGKESARTNWGHQGLTKYGRLWEYSVSGYHNNRSISIISERIGVDPDYYQVRIPAWYYFWQFREY